MKSAREHLQQFPHARPRTLALIEIRKEKTEQLQRENESKRMQEIKKQEASKALLNKIRDAIGYVPWFRRGRP